MHKDLIESIYQIHWLKYGTFAVLPIIASFLGIGFWFITVAALNLLHACTIRHPPVVFRI